MRIFSDDIQFILNRYNDFETIRVLTKVINTTNYEVLSNFASTTADIQLEYYSKKKLLYKNKIICVSDLFCIVLGLTSTGVKFNIPDDEKIKKRDVSSLARNLEKVKTRLDGYRGKTNWELYYNPTEFEGKFFSISLVSPNKTLNKDEEPLYSIGTKIRPMLIDKFE